MLPSRRGFILLFGSKPIISADHTAPAVNAVCPQCNQRAEIVGKIHRTWFTVFFIPIFPVSGRQRFSECSKCGARFPVDAKQLGAQMALADRDQSQRAITLYNSLRSSPANAITLNELMTLNASMGDFDSAISASREFPQAIDSSEQAMVTLGRVYLAKNDAAEAIRWFDAAIARNDSIAEAHYYKGVAYLTATPPDFAKAVAAARLARNHGHANADDLLREAESRARGETDK